MKVPLYAFIAFGLWWDAANLALAFLLPSMRTLLHTCWATHEHHAGHHADDHYSASVNRENNLFNLLGRNLGYHTAHQLRPGGRGTYTGEYAVCRARPSQVGGGTQRGDDAGGGCSPPKRSRL